MMMEQAWLSYSMLVLLRMVMNIMLLEH